MDDLDLSPHPNDAYFKEVFADPVRAALFFRRHLDPALVACIDWSSLKLEAGSFVKQTLSQTHTDLLFTARFDGREVFIYLLFEHQTRPDPSMPLRVLGYKVEILQKHYQRHGLPLPPVLSFVFHQGPDRWTLSPCFEDLFQLDDATSELLLPYLPKFRHALLDLTQLDPDKDEHDDQLRLVLQLMKLARQKRIGDFLVWIADEMARQGWQVPEPLVLLSYLYAMHTDERIDEAQIARSLQHQPNYKENIMSLAQQLIARGKAEGEAHGATRGAWIGKIQLLEQFLGLPASAMEAFASMSQEQLASRFAELEKSYNDRFKQA